MFASPHLDSRFRFFNPNEIWKFILVNEQTLEVWNIPKPDEENKHFTFRQSKSLIFTLKTIFLIVKLFWEIKFKNRNSYLQNLEIFKN